MSDRELLEKAARAAGHAFDHSIRPDGGVFYHSKRNAIALADGGWFAPLTDDGDALRLAVGLRLWIGQHDDGVTASDFYARFIEPVEEAHSSDPYAATRRAIVRAAAAIWDQQEKP